MVSYNEIYQAKLITEVRNAGMTKFFLTHTPTLILHVTLQIKPSEIVNIIGTVLLGEKLT